MYKFSVKIGMAFIRASICILHARWSVQIQLKALRSCNYVPEQIGFMDLVTRNMCFTADLAVPLGALVFLDASTWREKMLVIALSFC